MARVRVRSHMMSMMLPTLMRIMVITLPIVSVMLPTFDPYVTYDVPIMSIVILWCVYMCACACMSALPPAICCLWVRAVTKEKSMGHVAAHEYGSCIAKRTELTPPPRPHRATTTNKQRATHMKLIIPGRS